MDKKIEVRYINLEEVDSTNTYALKLIDTYEIQKKAELLPKITIVAQKQTGGRGRMNRKFFSPQFSGLYMTTIFYPKTRILTPALITPFAAVAVSRALNKKWGIQTQIKWVNDIYIGTKKICGILAEGHIDTKRGIVDSVTIGFGLNLFNKKFPDVLKEKAGSVFPENDFTADEKAIYKDEIRDLILEEFYALLDFEEEVCAGEPGKNQVLMEAMKEYRERSNVIGKTVDMFPVINTAQSYKATILDITDKAQLKIQKEDGSIHFVDTGEITMSN